MSLGLMSKGCGSASTCGSCGDRGTFAGRIDVLIRILRWSVATSGREVLRMTVPGAIGSRKAVVVAVAIIIAVGPASSVSALSLVFFGVVVGASIIRGAASLMPPASLCPVFAVDVLVVAAAPILLLMAVSAATRSVALVALAATLLIFLMLLTFLFLIEASRHLFEPGIRYLICAVHDAAQDELLHLGLLVCDR